MTKIQGFVTKDLEDKFVKICKELGFWDYEKDKPKLLYRVVQELIKNYPLTDSKEKDSADLQETSEVEPEVEEEAHVFKSNSTFDDPFRTLEEMMKWRIGHKGDIA